MADILSWLASPSKISKLLSKKGRINKGGRGKAYGKNDLELSQQEGSLEIERSEFKYQVPH